MIKTVLTLLIVWLSVLGASGAGKITEIYSEAGGDTLRLDFYKAQSDTPTPVMIFAFGGGFKGGQRDYESFMPMFDYMTRNGVSVVSIDYRTLLKNVPPTEMMSAEGFKSHLVAAIDTAASDFLKATAYVDAKAASWNIDVKQIFACGSSAGAITVLQAAYMLCNDDGLAVRYGLAAPFDYAGVISMAGAICADGEPRWARTPCPLLLFHGDADAIVPFDRAVLGGFGLYGSKSISDGLAKEGVPHRFHRVNGASHEISGTPMSEDCGEILDFIMSVCRYKEDRIFNTTEYRPGMTDYKTDFTIIDYIKANL